MLRVSERDEITLGALLCSQNFHVILLIWTRHLLVRGAIIIPSSHYLRSDRSSLWEIRMKLNARYGKLKHAGGIYRIKKGRESSKRGIEIGG